MSFSKLNQLWIRVRGLRTVIRSVATCLPFPSLRGQLFFLMWKYAVWLRRGCRGIPSQSAYMSPSPHDMLEPAVFPTCTRHNGKSNVKFGWRCRVSSVGVISCRWLVFVFAKEISFSDIIGRSLSVGFWIGTLTTLHKWRDKIFFKAQQHEHNSMNRRIRPLVQDWTFLYGIIFCCSRSRPDTSYLLKVAVRSFQTHSWRLAIKAFHFFGRKASLIGNCFEELCRNVAVWEAATDSWHDFSFVTELWRVNNTDITRAPSCWKTCTSADNN